jgi:hypothetical protein
MNIRHAMVAVVALLLLTPVLVPGLTTKAAFALAYVPPLVQHPSSITSRRRHLYGQQQINQQATYSPTLIATTTLWSQKSPGY